MRIFDEPVILFNKTFNDESLTDFMKQVDELEHKNSESFTMIINSPGGSISALQTMLDVIYNTPMHVTTVASGLAASCGFALLMAGDTRLSFPTAQLMSHQYSWGSRGKHHELLAARKAQDNTSQFMIGHYKLHTGLSETVISKELLPAEDRWITPEEALELNIIDGIIEHSVKPVGIFARNKIKDQNGKQELIRLKAMIATLAEKDREFLLKETVKNEVKDKKTNKVGKRQNKKADL